MLKTLLDDRIWLVTQPDHGRLAGQLAAHWGNRDGFAPLGSFGGPADAQLRREAVFAIAQHDNGWWEWEATPDLSPDDGLPLSLGEVLRDQVAGMERWRVGLRRFPRSPYANLLISRHAHWLYAIRALPDPDPAFAHPLFWKGSPEQLYPGTNEAPLRFLAELEEMAAGWRGELAQDPATAGWLEPARFLPHERLLQLCDGLSLALCSALIPAASGTTRGMGNDAFELRDVPRAGWEERVTITVTPLGDGRIALDPYPFDCDPLPLLVPAVAVTVPFEPPTAFASWWQSQPLQPLTFELVSRRG